MWGDGFQCFPVPTTTTTLMRAIYYSSVCKLGTFDCGNGTCIPISSYRDCKVDCYNGLDETCFNGFVKCDGCKCVAPSNAATFCVDRRCKFHRMKRTGCVYYQWAMDGIQDCPDGSDESKTISLLPEFVKATNISSKDTKNMQKDAHAENKPPLHYTTVQLQKTSAHEACLSYV
uniref:Uncharacterized protein n=1 Tax=Romanomermis culicivorax TaxID=13658 RepID=A0A915KY52_ROMCU